ncbi:MAG: hypothetical protein M3Z03_02015, partial [Actinomycetota bacterium]|nr:hypothetical protein [Actinomycetota bacterium]
MNGPSIVAIVRAAQPSMATVEHGLELLPHVDRVLVGCHAAAEQVAAALPGAEVVALPPLEDPEAADGLLLALVDEDWVLWVPDRERLERGLLGTLRSLVGDPDVVHYRFGDEVDRFATRLFRNDPALVNASGAPGSTPDVVGPHHLRRAARRGMADGAPLPEARGPVARRFGKDAVEAHWRNRPLRRSDHAAALRLIPPYPVFSVGVPTTLLVAVRNQGGAVWPGRDRSGPNIRLFARWLRAPDDEPTGVTVHAARTRGDLPPGAE